MEAGTSGQAFKSLPLTVILKGFFPEGSINEKNKFSTTTLLNSGMTGGVMGATKSISLSSEDHFTLNSGAPNSTETSAALMCCPIEVKYSSTPPASTTMEMFSPGSFGSSKKKTRLTFPPTTAAGYTRGERIPNGR